MLTQQDVQLFQQILDNALKNFATKDDLKDFVKKEDIKKIYDVMATKEDLRMEMEQIRKEMVTKTDFEMKLEQIRTEMVTHVDLQKAVDDIIDYTKTCFKITEEQFMDHEKRIVKLEHQQVILVNQ